MLVGGALIVVTTPQSTPAAPAPTTPPPAATEAPVVPPPPAGITYRDFIFETAVVTAPTATKTQSKLWFAHGAWWGALFQPFTNQVNIFRLDWESQLWRDTGTLVDERSAADPDVVWTGEHLYVLTAGSRETARNAARILRFSYDPQDERFTLDPNFPVTITDTGLNASVVTRDGTGTLWVAYVQGGRVWTVHSLEHDAVWSDPTVLPVPGATVADEDIASVTAFGPGLVGVMWSNQLEDRVYFSTHRDGDPPDAWSEPEVVMEGTDYVDDHINLKTYRDGDSTAVVAALKTSLDERTPINPLAPQILLAFRDADGAWTTHLVSRVREKHTRAIVIVDEDARMVYVAATSSEGTIDYKRASIDAISFETGEGVPLIASLVDPRISNATSTKQPVGIESGLVVLGSDNQTGRYLHGIVDIGAGMPAADPADTARPERPDPPDPLSPVTLVHNDFELWQPGDASGTDWALREEDVTASLTIADDVTGGRSLRLEPGPSGVSARACREFAQRPDSVLSIDLRVRVTGHDGASDTSILSLRGGGGEAAAVRVTSHGDFAWFAGAERPRAPGFVGGRVYRVTATIDQAARTFSFRVRADDGTVLVRQSGLAWRSGEVESVRSICLTTTSGQPAQVIDLLDVKVLERPAE